MFRSLAWSQRGLTPDFRRETAGHRLGFLSFPKLRTRVRFPSPAPRKPRSKSIFGRTETPHRRPGADGVCAGQRACENGSQLFRGLDAAWRTRLCWSAHYVISLAGRCSRIVSAVVRRAPLATVPSLSREADLCSRCTAGVPKLIFADKELDRTAVGVLDDDVHLAACGLDETLERREQHVAAALEPGHFGLVHVE